MCGARLAETAWTQRRGTMRSGSSPLAVSLNGQGKPGGYRYVITDAGREMLAP